MPITLDGRTGTPAANTEEQTAATVAALEREAAGYQLRQAVATNRLATATDPVRTAELQAELERATRMEGDVAAELTRLRGGGETRPRRGAQTRQS